MIVAFGSINADLIVPVPKLPQAGETVLGGPYSVLPGGKGAKGPTRRWRRVELEPRLCSPVLLAATVLPRSLFLRSAVRASICVWCAISNDRPAAP